MKRNLLMLLCVFAMVAACLVSCGGDETCNHTFDEEWYSDATSHWHPATCEHGEVKDSLGAHVDADEDGLCDVCAYDQKHVHTYESAWSGDETHHWHNATCSHSSEKGEYGLHSDEAKDGSCDICSAHVHNVNPTGYCTHSDCGKKVADVDETSLEAVINALYFQQGLINGGHIDHEMYSRSYHTTGGYNAHSVETVDYLFGKDGYTYKKIYTVTTSETTVESLLEGWYQPESAEETFGMVSYDGGNTFELDSSDPNKLYSYYFVLSTIADGHGAEALLLNVMDLILNSGSTTYLNVTPNPESNTISFELGILNVHVTTASEAGDSDNPGELIYNVNYYEITASIGYTDEFALTSLDINCDCYTNEAGAMFDDTANKHDISIEYDPETDTIKFVKYDEATDSFVETDDPIYNTYTFKVTQTVGERTEENTVTKERFIPESYDLYLSKDEDGNLYNKFDGATIVTNLKEAVNLYVSDYLPIGTSLHYVPGTISFKLFLNGEEIENVTDYTNETAVAMFTFSGELRNFFVVPKVKGVYRFEIYFLGEKTHEVTINAGTIKESDVTLKENEFAVRVTKKFEWATEVSFTAPTAGTYTFHLPLGLGLTDANGYDAAGDDPSLVPTPYYDYMDPNNTAPDGGYIAGSFELTLAEGETIRFYANGARNGVYVISYEIN